MFDLTGKNVVYVGAFSGVGYQVCRILMKKKISTLFVVGRMENVEMLKKLQTEGPTVKVVFIHMNLMDHTTIEHAVKQVVGVVKHVDVLVNGAGVVADKDVETTIGVNLTGMIHTTLMFMPYMDKTHMGHGGVVMNISSVYGVEPAPMMPVYAAAKHGVIGFTRSMAHEHIYHKTGVAFMTVLPGFTSTELMVNLRENVVMEHMADEMVAMINSAKHQTPEEVAMIVVKVIETMKNGGMYLAHLGQMKEIVPTVHWHM